jgi:hypothetical protein
MKVLKSSWLTNEVRARYTLSKLGLIDDRVIITQTMIDDDHDDHNGRVDADHMAHISHILAYKISS